MSSYSWSSNSSTITSSRASAKEEAAAVAKVVVIEERNTHSISIAVVQGRCLEKLAKECKSGRRWYRRRGPTLFTTAENLQYTIDSIELLERRRTLNLLFSTEISEISFHVSPHFTELKVLRCTSYRNRGTLLVEGSSTYNGVRLDKWQGHRHKYHALIIGAEQGVRIKVSDFGNIQNWSRCRSNFTYSDQQRLRQHFENLSGKTRWDEVKGTVAAIVGIAVGTAKFGVQLSGAVGGVVAKYQFLGHTVGIAAAGAKGSVAATAAGPAVVLGVGVAALVYFIPWDKLFGWLRTSLSWLWDKIYYIWSRFMDWVRTSLASGPSGNARMPMHFDL